MTKKTDSEKTIKQLKDELDQLLNQIDEAEAEEIESSTLKLKQAKEIISQIEKRLKFSEVELSEL
jgi:ribosomal protein S3